MNECCFFYTQTGENWKGKQDCRAQYDVLSTSLPHQSITRFPAHEGHGDPVSKPSRLQEAALLAGCLTAIRIALAA